MGSVIPILLTILLVIAGGFGCFLEPGITTLLLALICVYFVWKIQRFQNDNEAMKRQLQRILKILEEKETTAANTQSTVVAKEQSGDEPTENTRQAE